MTERYLIFRLPEEPNAFTNRAIERVTKIGQLEGLELVEEDADALKELGEWVKRVFAAEIDRQEKEASE